MKQARIITSTVLSSLFAGIFLILPLNANAGDFQIVNHTKKRISFKFNHACSHDFGVIRARKSKIIPDVNFRAACNYDPENCVVDIYQSGNCSGRHIAMLKLAIDDGVKEVLYSGQSYAFNWRAHYLEIVSRKR